MTTEAKLRETLKRSHDVMVLVERAAPGYDWNADIEGLTLIIGNLYTEIKEALSRPTTHHTKRAEVLDRVAEAAKNLAKTNFLDSTLDEKLNDSLAELAALDKLDGRE